MAEIESFEYYPGDSKVYREWLSRQPIYRSYDRWLMMLFVGLAVGLMGRVLYTLMRALSDIKYATLRRLLSRRQLFLAWFFNTVYSGALAFMAAYPVAHVGPAAAGSGVPEVMAYLNGCNVPKVFNILTFAVKFISTMCSVASGLPVGPEGPMIHLGAMVGAGLSQGDSSTLGCSTPCAMSSGVFGFRRFKNDKDKRDFITAGAACGVAVAFGAPIGGLLFAYEEVASHWRPSLAMLTFFACMTALWTDTTLESLQQSILKPGTFGAVSPSFDTAFEVNRKVTTHLLSVFPAAVVGVVTGALAAAFTACNLAVGRLRAKVIGSDKKRQVIEPVAIMVTYAMIAALLPLAFSCTSSGCVLDDAGMGGAALSPASGPHPPGSEAVGSGSIFCEGGSDHLHRIVEQSLLTFTCRSHWLAPDPASGNHSGVARGNATESKDYNELATLLHVSSEDAIRHLLSRGTHREFGYGPLFTFLLVYMVGAVAVAGSSISSGLFVPMLVVGAAVGRLVGLVLVDVAGHWGFSLADLAAGGAATAWIDPGVFALLGAGAFMGGVTRLSLSLAVIIMEMSGEQHFLLPILLGITIAKWTADAMHKPLYHALLEVKHAPFLPDEPTGAEALHLHDVSEVMTAVPITTFREREHVSTLRRALKDTTHQGFPVVRPIDGVGEVLVGMVSRAHVRVLLRAAAARGQDRGGGRTGISGESGDDVEAGQRSSSPVFGESVFGVAEHGDMRAHYTPPPRVSVQVEFEELDRRVLHPAAQSLVAYIDRAAIVEPTELNDVIGGVERDGRDMLSFTARVGERGEVGGEDQAQGAMHHDRPGGGIGDDGVRLESGRNDRHHYARPDPLLSLIPYLNRSTPRVPATCSVARVYDVFRSLGLRHLCVVDECNRVVGMVTRKELLDEHLEERLNHLGRTLLTGFARRRGSGRRDRSSGHMRTDYDS